MKWYAGAAALLLLALVLNLGLLAYAMYALLGVMIASRFLAMRWSAAVTADRECNRLTANVGDRVAVVIHVRNRSRLPVAWMLLEDLLPRHALLPPPPRLGVVGRRLQLVMLGPKRPATVFYQLECRQRGYYQIGPLMLETGDLFGLYRRYRLLTRPHFLLVYPRVITPEGYDIASRRPIGEVRMAYRLYEDPTRIAGVRRYQAGDPLNRVHWKATARTGQLHSKVYEPSTVAGATLLLDFHLADHDPKHEPVRSETAITAAASLAHALYLMGQQVGLVSNGRDAADRIRQEGSDPDPRSRKAARESGTMAERSDRLRPVIVETRHGPEQYLRIMETLARLELSDGLTMAELIAETTSRMPRDATVIAIVPQVSPQTAIALGNLCRQGFAVTALVNLYGQQDFSYAAGRLMTEGVEARHLDDEAAIAELCKMHVLA